MYTYSRLTTSVRKERALRKRAKIKKDHKNDDRKAKKWKMKEIKLQHKRPINIDLWKWKEEHHDSTSHGAINGMWVGMHQEARGKLRPTFDLQDSDI